MKKSKEGNKEIKKTIKNVKKSTSEIVKAMEKIHKINDPITDNLYMNLGKQVFLSIMQDLKILGRAFDNPKHKIDEDN